MTTVKRTTQPTLEEILKETIERKLRGFKLAYLKHLRTGRRTGHETFRELVKNYVWLANEYKPRQYDFDKMIFDAMVECQETIDAEHNQLNFLQKEA